MFKNDINNEIISKKPGAIPSMLFWAVFLPCTFMVGMYFALSWFALPDADDSLYYSLLKEHGLIGGTIYYYKAWSGRYIATLLIFLFCKFDLIENYKWFSIFNLSLFCASFFVFLKTVLGRFYDIRRLLLLVASLALACFLVLINPKETLYWVCGFATYTISISLSLLFLSFLFAKRNTLSKFHGFFRALILFLLPFIICGQSEVSAALLLEFIVLFGLWKYFQTRKIDFELILPLLAIIAGIAIIFLAPGNFERKECVESSALVQGSIYKKAVIFFTIFSGMSLLRLIGPMLFPFYMFWFVVGIFSPKPSRANGRLCLWLLAIAIIMTLTPIFLAAISLGSVPARIANISLIVSVFIIFWLVLSLAWLVPPTVIQEIKIHRPKKWVLILCLLFLCSFVLPVMSSRSFEGLTRDLVYQAKICKQAFNSRNKLIKAAAAANESRISVPTLDFNLSPEILVSNDYLSTKNSNKKIAEYFGMKEIIAIKTISPSSPAIRPRCCNILFETLNGLPVRHGILGAYQKQTETPTLEAMAKTNTVSTEK